MRKVCNRTSPSQPVYLLSSGRDVPIDRFFREDLEKKLKEPLAKATLADAIEAVSDVFSKDEIVRIISEEM